MEPYVLSFWLLAAICAVQTFSLRHVIFSSSSSSEQAPSPAFYKFRRVYLVAFLLAMGGDWLQGPYVYALYQQYGFTQSDIALLFVTGFLSSAFFGTLFGSVADTLCAALSFVVVVDTWIVQGSPPPLGRVLPCVRPVVPDQAVHFLWRAFVWPPVGGHRDLPTFLGL